MIHFYAVSAVITLLVGDSGPEIVRISVCLTVGKLMIIELWCRIKRVSANVHAGRLGAEAAVITTSINKERSGVKPERGHAVLVALADKAVDRK